MQVSAASDGKAPRTARGERTLRKILEPRAKNSASADFPKARSSASRSVPASRSVHSTPISIQRRRCSRRSSATCPAQVRDNVGPAFKGRGDALDGERRALEAFLEFVRDASRHLPDHRRGRVRRTGAYREHYETTAAASPRASSRLATRARSMPDFSDEDLEVIAWGMMGANVFLGLAFLRVGRRQTPSGLPSAMSRVWRNGYSA